MKHLLHAALFMAVILLAGCSQAGADSREEENRPITLCYELFGSQTAEDTENEWYRELERMTGEKIAVQRIPSVNYVSRIERMTTADSLPMAVAANDSLMSSPVMRRAISAGSFWKLDDYIEDYPALYQLIGEQFWESVRIDGAVYGIPRLRIQPRNGLYYRADWAQRGYPRCAHWKSFIGCSPVLPMRIRTETAGMILTVWDFAGRIMEINPGTVLQL